MMVVVAQLHLAAAIEFTCLQTDRCFLSLLYITHCIFCSPLFVRCN
jgi:hypothetical protein